MRSLALVTTTKKPRTNSLMTLISFDVLCLKNPDAFPCFGYNHKET